MRVKNENFIISGPAASADDPVQGLEQHRCRVLLESILVDWVVNAAVNRDVDQFETCAARELRRHVLQ